MRDREVETGAIREADCFELQEYLTQEVSNPTIGLTATNIDDPLAKDCSIYQRVTPERITDSGMLMNELPHGVVCDKCNPARAN
jgi:hypothetical protein